MTQRYKFDYGETGVRDCGIVSSTNGRYFRTYDVISDLNDLLDAVAGVEHASDVIIEIIKLRDELIG